MSKTNDLRKTIVDILNGANLGTNGIYYEVASDNIGFPHIVFSLDSVILADLNRQDYRLAIDIWDRSSKATTVEEIADRIEEVFNNLNAPQDNILPTFFLESKRTMIDEDKKIRHKQVVISVQNYER